jgi:hypothetical protein
MAMSASTSANEVWLQARTYGPREALHSFRAQAASAEAEQPPRGGAPEREGEPLAAEDRDGRPEDDDDPIPSTATYAAKAPRRATVSASRAFAANAPARRRRRVTIDVPPLRPSTRR